MKTSHTEPAPRKARSRYSVLDVDPRAATLARRTGHRTLARWAVACAARVLPFFEARFPRDRRPREALDTLRAWIETGVFRMAVIRRASLSSHAAAREVGEDTAARSAARSAGQAVAAAHVREHALGAAHYAVQGIRRDSDPARAESRAARERAWQYRRLRALRRAGRRAP